MTAPGKKRYDDLAAERHWREWSLRAATSFVSHHRDEDGRLTTAIARTAKEIKEAKSKSHNKCAAKDAIAFTFWKSLAGGGQALSLSPPCFLLWLSVSIFFLAVIFCLSFYLRILT